jgi:hypothetical protein
LEKFRGVFAKIPWHGDFWILHIYFPKENFMEYDHSS